MNVLLYTSAMLMVLSLLSYNALTRASEVQSIRLGYYSYMEEQVREYSRHHAELQYQSKSSGGSLSSEDGEKQERRVKNPYLGLKSLFSKGDSLNESLPQRQVFTGLLEELFAKESFYEKALEEGINLDSFVSRLIEKGVELQLKDADHLANIDLQDEEAQELLYSILSWRGVSMDGSSLSLSDLITFANDQPTWLFYARPELITVFYGERSAAASFCAERPHMFKSWQEQLARHPDSWESLQGQLQSELDNQVQKTMFSHGTSHYLDLVNSGLQKTVAPPSWH